MANIAAFGVFFPSLTVASGGADSFPALLLASLGAVLALAGAALVLRSRAALGSAWSFVPKVDRTTGLIILLIVLAVRGIGGFGSRGDSASAVEKTPLQILQERYARGEIDNEEYEERRKTLSS